MTIHTRNNELKENETLQFYLAKAERRMPHPISDWRIQITISSPRLATISSPTMRTGKLMIWANRCYYIPLASSEVNFIADASGIVFMLFLFSKVIINISNLNQKKKIIANLQIITTSSSLSSSYRAGKEQLAISWYFRQCNNIFLEKLMALRCLLSWLPLSIFFR